MKKVIVFFLLMSFTLFAEEGRKLGLVLSGGGAKGFAHIGLLKVLDEEKIPVECITGTSMGSIVGALYAMGYNADELEKIVLDNNWFDYFNDDVPRIDAAIDDKFYKDRFPLTFKVKDWTIKLPKGVIKGQKIENFLSKLYFDAAEIKDFNKFPIPFNCIATDIETGKVVVLTKGNIAEAVRASMAIPSIFEPVEIDGKMLVDGMMSKNFPVREVKNMGANCVIGCDVGGRLKTKEQVNSFFEIIDQTMNYRLVEATDEERKYVDMLILPRVENFSTTDFKKSKEIIAEGEKAARLNIEELRKYKNEKLYNIIKEKRLKKMKVVYIDKIEIIGTKKYNKKVIKQVIAPKLPFLYSSEDLNRRIEKLYSLGFFEKINYNINNSILEIKVEESAEKELKLGFNYNSTTRGELFFNGIIKGFGTSGSKTGIDIVLGKDEDIKLHHTQYSGVINKIGFIASAEYSNTEDFAYYFNDKKVSEYEVKLFILDFMAGNFISDRTMAGIGLKREFLASQSEIYNDTVIPKLNKNYGEIYVKYMYDSLDNIYFPKEGIRINGEIGYGEKQIGNCDFTNYKLELNKVFKLNKKLVFNVGGKGNIVYGEDIPEDKNPSMGGIYSRQNSLEFWGLEPSRYLANKIGVASAECFYEFSPSRYLIIRYNEAFLEEGKRKYDIIYGGGIGVGANTAVGPIKILLSKSNHDELSLYLNVGYNF